MEKSERIALICELARLGHDASHIDDVMTLLARFGGFDSSKSVAALTEKPSTVVINVSSASKAKKLDPAAYEPIQDASSDPGPNESVNFVPLFGSRSKRASRNVSAYVLGYYKAVGRPIHFSECKRALAGIGIECVDDTILGACSRFVAHGYLSRPQHATYQFVRAPKSLGSDVQVGPGGEMRPRALIAQHLESLSGKTASSKSLLRVLSKHGISRSTVHKTCSDMVRDGEIERVYTGLYRAVAKTPETPAAA